MTCMWNKDGLSFENYSLYYWYNSDGVKAAAPCAHYLQERGINIGCWFNSSAVRTFSTFNVRLNSSKQEHKQLFRNLQDLVKLEPPVKLHVENTSDLELLLSWEPSRGFRLLCFTYQVKYRSLASDSWTVKNVTSTQFSLPSYSRDKLYTFHVRSKLSDLCASAVLWSEWSVGVSWGRNDTIPITETSLPIIAIISVGFSIAFFCVLAMLIRTERIWVILVPQIPNPEKGLQDLYKMYDGDFQEWIGVSKDVVKSLNHNYTEPLCSVCEDTECPVVENKKPPPT
ncbi:cytokine receptor common subunit gamma isoform X2 [Xenopus laevis]|nr:cytokine receptor common subunit gamma isoform X2 [Xenopus laevis]